LLGSLNRHHVGHPALRSGRHIRADATL